MPNLYKSSRKEIFISLAEAYLNNVSYRDKLYNSIKDLATEHGEETDFLGLPYEGTNISNTILEILDGRFEDFSYFVFECDKSFDRYNEGITLENGEHPDVHSLGDLYDFIMSQESE